MTAVNLGLLCAELAKHGVALKPLEQTGVPLVLRWDTNITGPILGDDTLVAFPDMHLSGFSAGDIFRGTDPNALVRLTKILRAFTAARTSFPSLRFVQLGDLYDVWRAYPEYRDHPTSDYRTIEDAYGEALGLLVQTLQARVCIGNHDATLAQFPPSWARRADGRVTKQLAYGHRFGARRVLAFHGHQEDTLDRLPSQDGAFFVKLATEAAKLSNPLFQSLEQKLDLVSDYFGDTDLSLHQAFSEGWPDATAPADTQGFTASRWCKRGRRELMESLLGRLDGASELRLVFVGHSHRPGIAALQIQNRLVPIIDVGSWVWGRSQLAIATEGQLALYDIT